MDIVELIKGKIAYESEIGITIHYMHRQELEGICDEIERLREALTNLDSAINQWSSTDSMVKKTLLKLIADALKEGE